MLIRAYWQFYKEVLPYMLAFGLLCAFIFGLIWGYILYVLLGTFVGFFGFQTFKKNQFYFYFNLGITKWKLFNRVFMVNGVFGILALIVSKLIISLFLGSF